MPNIVLPEGKGQDTDRNDNGPSNYRRFNNTVKGGGSMFLDK